MQPIKEKPELRDGISFRFSGSEPDAEGEPNGEWFAQELIVPPLNLDSLRRLAGRLAKLAGGTAVDAESFDTIVLATEQALRRNYFNVPRWLIEQSIDVANMSDFTQSFMDLSGLRRKEIEAKKATAGTMAQSTGTSSTGI